MKKVLLLLIIFTLSCTFGWAQLGVGQQFQNNNFESWTTETWTTTVLWVTTNHTADVPLHWHSINDGTGSLVGSARNEDFVQKASGSPGGGQCVKLTSQSILGVNANGGLTNGRFNAGSMTATNTANCTYSSTNSNYQTTLTSYPDSVYIYLKTSSSSNNARVNIVIHNNSIASNNAYYQDPVPTSSGNSYVNTSGAVNEAKVVAKATWNNKTNNNWQLIKIPFDYDTYIDNNTSPSFVLATFSTAQTAGGGAAYDELYIDDIVLIYNTRLATLTVGGNPLDGFNSETTTYNYSTPICAGAAFPSVTGTCQSGHASAVITHDPSDAEPYTIIRVRHQNQINTVYKDYRINFTIVSAPDAPIVSAPNPDCSPVAHPVTLTATSTGATSYRWYTTATGGTGTEVTTTTYNAQGVWGSVTYYVSAVNNAGCESARTPVTATVNPTPNAPTAGNTTPVCSGGTGIFTATLPAGDNLVCRWYATNSSTEVLGTGTSLEVSNLTQNTTRYAETYNSITGCYSGRTAVTVNVNSAPAVPTNLAGGSRCGAGTVSLSATPAAGTICQWFAAETGGNALGNGNSFTTPSIASTTNYYVASYNENTGCSSARQLVTATINDLPAAPTAGNTAAVCPGENGIFTATLPSGDNLQCRWYETSNSEAVLGTATSLTVNNLTQNTSRFVSTYNTVTGCESGRTEVSVNVKALPNAPTLADNSRCGAGDVTLNVVNAHMTIFTLGMMPTAPR